MTSLPTDGLFAFDPDAAGIYADFPSPFASTFFLFYFLGFNRRRRRRRIRASCHFVSSLLHPLLVDWPLFPPHFIYLTLFFCWYSLSLSRPALDVEHVNTLLRRRPSQINDRKSLLIDAISMAIPKASKLKELGRHLNSRQFLFFFHPIWTSAKSREIQSHILLPFPFEKISHFPSLFIAGEEGEIETIWIILPFAVYSMCTRPPIDQSRRPRTLYIPVFPVTFILIFIFCPFHSAAPSDGRTSLTIFARWVCCHGPFD